MVNLAASLDVALETAEHPVQLTLLLLVELPADPGEGGEHAIGKPVPPHLGHALLQAGVNEVVQKLEQGPGRHHVTVDQVREEPEQVAGIGPLARLQTILIGEKD